MRSSGMWAPDTASGRSGLLRNARVCIALFAALALLADAAPAAAQTLSTGIISGAVLDETGTPLNGVIVTITNRANGQRVRVQSDRSGMYGSGLLPPGRYNALYERLGYEPLLVEGILVTAGANRDLQVRVNSVQGPVTSRRVTAANAALSRSGLSGPDRWHVSAGAAPSMPFDGLGLEALLTTSSVTGPRSEIEGLPAAFNGVILDGVPMAKRARGFDVFTRLSSLPLAYFGQVGLVTTDVDVEYGGGASGYLTGYTRRGGRESTVSAWGDFANDAMAAGTREPSAFTSYRAGALVAGSLIRDTANFVVGAEVSRSRLPHDALWAENAESTGLAAAALARYGVDLGPYVSPDHATLERESVFGRVDIPIAEDVSVSLRGFYANLPQTEPIAPWTGSPVGSAITARTRELLGTVTLLTRISEATMTELAAGAEWSRATGQMVSEPGAALPRTVIVSAGHEFGSDREPEFESELVSFQVRGVLHVQSGSHWRKFGLMATLPRYKLPSDIGRAGTWVFSDAADFETGFGQFRAIESAQVPAEFSTRRVSFLAQDRWRVNRTVELLVGARLTSFRLPDSSGIMAARGWQQLTGIINYRMPARLLELEPRFGVTLTPGDRDEWKLHSGISVDADIADPNVIAEVVSNDATSRVRAGIGQLDPWPEPPSDSVAMSQGATLAMLGRKFRGPRSTRVFGSVTRYIGTDGSISVGFTHRNTEFLPQRVDLNLQPVIGGFDQFGRVLYGQLEKHGALLSATPGSNRRFGNHEAIWGVQATGESSYTGVTVSAERTVAGPLGFFGSYTYSKSEDDWLSGWGGDPFTQIAPSPDTSAQTDWSKGRSDLDVPHRAVIGAEIRLPGALAPTLAAVFRYQSGYPFTPGFRPGVDANADGSATNDPAFVDEGIAGMSELFGEWPCLRDDAGRFARRNACRGPDIRNLDARFAMTIQRESSYSLTLVVDGLNLVASGAGFVDGALYLIDPDAQLEERGQGTFIVPLVVNPDFGQPLTRFAPMRQLRVGLRVGF